MIQNLHRIHAELRHNRFGEVGTDAAHRAAGKVGDHSRFRGGRDARIRRHGKLCTEPGVIGVLSGHADGVADIEQGHLADCGHRLPRVIG